MGTVDKGGTCYDRLCTIRDIGIETVVFDTNPYLYGGARLFSSIRNRTKSGLNILKLNKDLLNVVARCNGITHIWFDKAIMIWPSTLRKIKTLTDAILVHYTPDPQIIWHRSRHFVKSIPLYNILFTTKPFELEQYKALGAKKAHLTYQAYDKYRFRPAIPSHEDLINYGCDVVFIGHYEKYRADSIKAIVDSGVKVKVWGQYWPRYAKLHPWARNVVMASSVICDQYSLALISASICLGLLSRFIPETTTTRTFEIPACGAFMLADRTKEHLDLFEEGNEAEFFSSKEELLQKVHYYLDHPQERKEIAKAGRQRCINSGYSFHERLKNILEIIRDIS